MTLHYEQSVEDTRVEENLPPTIDQLADDSPEKFDAAMDKFVSWVSDGMLWELYQVIKTSRHRNAVAMRERIDQYAEGR